MKDRQVQEVDNVIRQHLAAGEAEECLYLGQRIVIHRDVFSPFIAPSGLLSLAFASFPIFRGKHVLDVGCGAGVTACFAALSGAQRVVGVDVNPAAIENAKDNARRLSVSRRTVFLESDLFDRLDSTENFDVIYADLPFLSQKAANPFERAFFDSDLRSIKTFVRHVRRYLKDDLSAAYLCLSNLHNTWQEISVLADDGGLRGEKYMQIQLGWIDMTLLKLVKK